MGQKQQFKIPKPTFFCERQENGNKVVMAGEDGMGNSVLDACWACMTSGCANYPGKTWAEVCQECLNISLLIPAIQVMYIFGPFKFTLHICLGSLVE